VKPRTAILIGAGDRGTVYTGYARNHPDALRIVGVAEPVPERRERIAALHGIPARAAFRTWEEILELPQMADGALIATQDTMHVAPAVAALEKGYHVLMEKPMALTLDECTAVVNASLRTGLTLNVCHVLRYTDFFNRIRQILEDGIIGDIYSIYHAENVSYYHMAHSFVRGNWRSSSEASPMILAKCCHDMDLIYWYAGSMPARISSFGGLHHFTPANAPAGAPERCTDGCPVTDCAYEAVQTYLYGIPLKLGITKTDSIPARLAARFMLRFPRFAGRLPWLSQFREWHLWPTSTITEDLSEEGIMRALREGPYGRCVYRCDNDQVDHQETIIEFENGITAMLKMHGHAEQEGRTVRIDGSRGTIRGKFGGGGRLEVHLHGTGKRTVYGVKTDLIGHAEGDEGIMENFVTVLNGGRGLTSARDSLQSHLMAFAAHTARVEQRVVQFTEYAEE
jgi:predicted dehydrogenase